MVSANRNSVGMPDWKRLLRKLRCRSDDSIKLDLKETAFESVNWSCVVGFV
jgi:hypothetical protein